MMTGAWIYIALVSAAAAIALSGWLIFYKRYDDNFLQRLGNSCMVVSLFLLGLTILKFEFISVAGVGVLVSLAIERLGTAQKVWKYRNAVPNGGPTGNDGAGRV